MCALRLRLEVLIMLTVFINKKTEIIIRGDFFYHKVQEKKNGDVEVHANKGVHLKQMAKQTMKTSYNYFEI